MRLGGPIHGDYETPEAWVALCREAGYSAAYCPVKPDAEDGLIQEYAHAASEADIVIAETGAWCNPMDPDQAKREAAQAKCRDMLLLAEKVGARCCVNVAGSRGGDQWAGHHPDNFTQETFDLIVQTTQDIIDSVQPEKACFTLEPMPWMYPDSPDNYVNLIRAIERDGFAAHFDPVNIVSSPQRYYFNGSLIEEFCEKLGPHIRSCHAKDISLSGKLTVHLDEVRPGTGNLDYAVFLTEVEKLDADMPVMLEHLSSAEDYRLAAEYVRKVAQELGVVIK